MRLLSLLGLLVVPALAAQQPASPAQPSFTADSAAVMQVVTDLFKGMRTRDTSLMRAQFHPSATMRSAYNGRAGMTVEADQVDQWLRGVAAAPDTLLLDERITAPLVRVDENFATVWTPYEFWLGNTFSHCGADLFSFARTSAGWKIVFVADSRHRSGCASSSTNSPLPPFTPPARAVDSAAAIATTLRLLDGMRTRDTAQMRAALDGSVPMYAAVQRAVALVGVDSAYGWLTGVGLSATMPILDERLAATAVEINDNLAQVSAYYTFRRGDQFSHCGMDQFVLGRTGDGWKVVGVAYSVRRTGCADSLTLDPRRLALRDLAAAERAFARMADTANVRDAFVQALAPDAIAVDEDGVHNMHDQYVAKPVRAISLRWEPSWTDVSADGLFGITTGPWEFRPARDSAVAARGQFLTIWKKGPEGWRVALDHGVGGDTTAALTGALEAPEAATPDRRSGNLERLLSSERSATHGKGWQRGLQSLAAHYVRVMRDGSPNAFGPDAIALPAGITSAPTFTSLGGTVAGSGDLAGTWGTWRAGDKGGAYVHIWRHTSEGWKIAVELMN